ncbi:MAG TPA: hypothetical protein VFM61_05515 [Pseudidiomarina sp.]|nr:hypothetical protein [Pseudidiomarina sp.]
MQIKKLAELIEWTRALHQKLAACLAHCATRHNEERVVILLEYLASHELAMEKMVAAYGREADIKATQTFVYDYLSHPPITPNFICDEHYATMTAAEINNEVFNFHQQINSMYRTLLDTAVIPEVKELMQALLDMEENETRRLVRQVARDDL